MFCFNVLSEVISTCSNVSTMFTWKLRRGIFTIGLLSNFTFKLAIINFLLAAKNEWSIKIWKLSLTRLPACTCGPWFLHIWFHLPLDYSVLWCWKKGIRFINIHFVCACVLVVFNLRMMSEHFIFMNKIICNKISTSLYSWEECFNL